MQKVNNDLIITVVLGVRGKRGYKKQASSA
jgi:hypothetical protein